MSGHAVIVGGGVIGLCTALSCALRGWRVTLVERNGEERDGCSFQNAGVIVPSHFVPLAAPGMAALGLGWMWNPRSPFRVKPRASWALADWVVKFWRAANAGHVRRAGPVLRDLTLASRRCYEDLSTLENDIGFAKSGTLMLCRSRHALDEEARTAEHARELGIAAEVLDARRTAELDPGVRMDVTGSVHYPQDCNVVPASLMASLQRRSAGAGVQYAWDTEVSDWRADGKTIRALKLCDGREIEADAFVLCAGAWSAGLARKLGLTLPLEAGAGYSLTLPHPRQAPRLCAMLTEARVAVTPMGGALRFGGTMELAGLNGAFSPERVRGMIAAILRYYPDLKPADLERIAPWRGLRPCSPDGLPYLGRTDRYSNLVIATGHAMMGITLGPITGNAGGRYPGGRKAGDRYCDAVARSLRLARPTLVKLNTGTRTRVGLISDTHGLIREEALRALAGCAHIIHAGDIVTPAILDRLREIAPLTAVRGNNDRGAWADSLPDWEVVEFGPVSVYVRHDRALLDFDPPAAGFRAIVTGHSHKPAVETREGVLYVNPGSAGPRRFKLPIAVGELVIERNRVDARIIELAV